MVKRTVSEKEIAELYITSGIMGWMFFLIFFIINEGSAGKSLIVFSVFMILSSIFIFKDARRIYALFIGVFGIFFYYTFSIFFEILEISELVSISRKFNMLFYALMLLFAGLSERYKVF